VFTLTLKSTSISVAERDDTIQHVDHRPRLNGLAYRSALISRWFQVAPDGLHRAQIEALHVEQGVEKAFLEHVTK